MPVLASANSNLTDQPADPKVINCNGGDCWVFQNVGKLSKFYATCSRKPMPHVKLQPQEPKAWDYNSHLIFPMPATYLPHFIFHDLTTLIPFGEEHKLRSSALCNSLCPSHTSCFIDPNILIRILFSALVSRQKKVFAFYTKFYVLPSNIFINLT
jgi:hypothetical protein